MFSANLTAVWLAKASCAQTLLPNQAICLFYHHVCGHELGQDLKQVPVPGIRLVLGPVPAQAGLLAVTHQGSQHSGAHIILLHTYTSCHAQATATVLQRMPRCVGVHLQPVWQLLQRKILQHRVLSECASRKQGGSGCGST